MLHRSLFKMYIIFDFDLRIRIYNLTGSAGDWYVHLCLHECSRLSSASQCGSVWTQLFFLQDNEKEEILFFEITFISFFFSPLSLSLILSLYTVKHIQTPSRLLAIVLEAHWGGRLRIKLTLESRMQRVKQECSNILNCQIPQMVEPPLGV